MSTITRSLDLSGLDDASLEDLRRLSTGSLAEAEVFSLWLRRLIEREQIRRSKGGEIERIDMLAAFRDWSDGDIAQALVCVIAGTVHLTQWLAIEAMDRLNVGLTMQAALRLLRHHQAAASQLPGINSVGG